MEFTGERLVPGAADRDLEIEHLDRYWFAAQFVAGKAVLDAACGTGYGSAVLGRSAASVLGIDISEEAIQFAAEQYEMEAVTFAVASVTEIPAAAGSFDVVVSFETLEHIDEQAQTAFLSEIRRVLKPEGVLIISTPNHEIYSKRGENEFHVHELSYGEFEQLLKHCFENVKLLTQKWEICDVIIPDAGSACAVRNGLPCRQAEYMIAVCSNASLAEIGSQVFIKEDNALEKLMDWAVENDVRNTANNKHLAELDAQVLACSEQIAQLRDENGQIKASNEQVSGLNERLNAANERLNAANEQLKDTNEQLNAANELFKDTNERLNAANEQLKDTNEQLNTANEQLRDTNEQLESGNACITKENERLNASVEQLVDSQKQLESQNARLMESKTELDRIMASRSWRFMGHIWRLRDLLVPKQSKRRLAGKLLISFFRHPVMFLRKCTPERIGKFFSALRHDSVSELSRRVDDSLVGLGYDGTGSAQVKLLTKADGMPSADEGNAFEYAPLTVPALERPLVSIVIPVYNQFDYTYLCIKSILEHSGDIAYEIIIADDCSTDLTTQIDQIISGLNVIHNPENLRFLRNCNNAAKQARGEYILFLNNDTQVQLNWLAPLVELIERAGDIGMVGSKLVYPDGRLQEAGGILWKDGSAWNYGNRADPALPEYNYVKEADYISGAAIMIRRRLWEEIGGFDERFAPAYCEDSDLAFEVRRRGYRVMYQPASVVVHFEGVSNGTDLSSGQKAYQVENQKTFYEKWKDVLEAEHNPNAVDPFLARERGVGKKVLLMVDHYVPQFDKDAGSRTVYQYIQLFIKQGYHVKFIGDNYYPHQPYTSVLQQLGVEVLYGPYYATHWKEWLKQNGQSIQYAFLNRPHIAVNYIDEIRRNTPARIVYYGHDLHFLRESREYLLTRDEAKKKSSEEWKKRELALMRKADMSYYPSVVEVEEIHRIDPDIRVKAIPAYLFSEVKKPAFCAAERKDMMFIGGFVHGPNVDAVKWLAKEIMPALETMLPDARVFILGSNPPEEVKALETDRLRIVGFVTDEELEAYYRTCRLALVPLRYGAGIKGKIIEAMRFGLPVVTTSVGAEGIVGASDILTIADEGGAFAGKAAELYQNEEALRKQSEASCQYILDNFTPENAVRVIRAEFDME